MPMKTIRELNEIRKLQVAISNRLEALREQTQNERYAEELYELEKNSWDSVSMIEKTRRSVNFGIAQQAEQRELREILPDTKPPKREVLIIGGVRV